ncbi:ATP-binding protein [Micrococcus luteus]
MSRLDPPTASQLSPADTIDAWKALTDRPEDQWFERKSGRIAAKDLAKALVAFANAEGGTVAVGVHSGRYDGHHLNAERENALRQAPLDFTHPPVRARFTETDSPDGRVLLIHVDPSEHIHETNTGDVYLRVGDESKKLSYVQRRELEYDRGSAQFEAEPAGGGFTLEDLDRQALTDYKSALGIEDTARALRARSLLTRADELTNASILLLGDRSEDVFPSSFVRVLRFRDDVAGTGTRQSLEAGKDERFYGPLPHIIDSAVARVTEWMPHRRALTTYGRFENVPLIPVDALLEGIVNAVVHRSYSLGGDHVRVSIFPSRIEIESPGRFPGLADPRKPLEIARYARNPRIARVLSDLGITLERGEGIRRMFEEMRNTGLADPVYEQTSGSVRLILTSERRLDEAVRKTLPAGAEDVLEAMQRIGRPVGTGEVIELTGRSRPWVRHALEELKGAGLIVWEGKSPRDPRAQWRLAD